MSKRSLLTAALFALVTANSYVLFTQSAAAQSANAGPGGCNISHSVTTNDIDKLSADEYASLYQGD